MAASAAPLTGVQSRYTDAIIGLSKQDVSPIASPSPKDPSLLLNCLSSPDNDTYIGLKQRMLVHAPIDEVAKIIDDVPHYKDLFEDLNQSEIHEKDGDRYVVFSETHIPIPFVANERDEMIYEKERVSKSWIRYRYQLKSSNHLKFNDGTIILKSTGDSTHGWTYYEEYDFWDASWGIAKTFGIDRIWKDCAKGIAQSDLAIKLKAENPGWSFEKAKDESLRARDALPLDACVKQRKPFQKSELEPSPAKPSPAP